MSCSNKLQVSQSTVSAQLHAGHSPTELAFMQGCRQCSRCQASDSDASWTPRSDSWTPKSDRDDSCGRIGGNALKAAKVAAKRWLCCPTHQRTAKRQCRKRRAKQDDISEGVGAPTQYTQVADRLKEAARVHKKGCIANSWLCYTTQRMTAGRQVCLCTQGSILLTYLC